jgi:phage gp46-like protein
VAFEALQGCGVEWTRYAAAAEDPAAVESEAPYVDPRLAFEAGLEGLAPGAPSVFPPPSEWAGESLDDLEVAGLLSLFSDRRVEFHELPAGDSDRRGWWGDTFETEPLGSRIWLAERGKASEITPQLVARWAREALQWLIVDGVCSSIEIEAEEATGNLRGVFLNVTFVRDLGERVSRRYDALWRGLNG